MFEPDIPALRELPDESERYLGDTIGDLGALPVELRIALGWTAALSAHEADILAMAGRTVPFFRYAAVGFLDESVDRDYRGNQFPPFGIVLYADAADQPNLRTPTLNPFRLTDSDVPFPIAVRRGTYEPQSSSSPQPSAGQVACWATTRQGSHQGWLTARHTAAALGTVIDAAGDCTDAALVSIGRPKPSLSVHRAAYTQIAAGLGSELHFRQGNLPATVLDVSIDFDIYKNPKFPVRFSLNASGQRSNSGALVTEATSASPLGIYLGRFLPLTANPGQTPSGFALATYQLEKMLDMEVFL